MKKLAFIGAKSPSRTALLRVAALAAAMVIAGPAAAEGLEKVNQGVENLLSVLNVISVSIVTIAVIVAGYKMAFARASFIDVVPILGGGILIGAAPQLARFLIN
ncbi:type IV secretion protein VirB2 [Xanthomonas phaseoli pv. phaseoli]|uniref:TrbC/VirB2 family protein n=1 Tax=Xanthomonas phaseoli TaxID=1985254 RepID=UPI000538A48C|nr:TrbC/VirB2 family protein [Xanthomonas phaseoli]KGU50059.1 type IV secretion protein VirB2 [Xanthomonas phaseoli pv. phaseoli]